MTFFLQVEQMGGTDCDARDNVVVDVSPTGFRLLSFNATECVT